MTAQLELVENMEQSPTRGVLEQTIEICTALHHWRDKIEEALDDAGNPMNFDNVAAMAIAGQVHVYGGKDYLALMEVLTFPNYRTYHCFIACGELEAVKALEPHMHEVAKQLGCKYLTINGRAGWIRAMKDLGYKHRFSTVYKEV